MKKKILFVINSLGLGGAEKSLTSLLNVMDYSRYSVDLLMFNPGGMFMTLLPKQVNILPQLNFLKSNQSIKMQVLRPKYLLARITASIGLCCNKGKNKLHPAQCYWKYAGFAFNVLPGHYDAAIAWGQGNPTHYVARKVRAAKKIAVINVDYEAAGHKKDFDRCYYREYQYIANVSDDLCSNSKKVFPEFQEKMVTLYDINNGDMIARMAEKENPFAREPAPLKIVTAGRLVAQKGYDLAVDAAEILKRQGICFKWFFVGEGPERTRIETLIAQANLEKQIVLVGATDNPYVYMKHADIYVQTSRFEGYCLTLGEARMLNTPVISTNFDVVYNQLRDGENGLIVEMNPKAIADAIQRLWNDVELRNQIVETLKKEKKGNTEEIEKLYDMIEG